MLVDIHTHTFPAHKAPEVLATLVRKSASRCPLHPQGNGTIADLVRQEIEDGFDRFAICPIAVRPEQFNYMTRFLHALDVEAVFDFTDGLVKQAMFVPADLGPQRLDFTNIRRTHPAAIIQSAAVGFADITERSR